MNISFQEQGYNGAVRLGSRAFQYITNLVMQTAIKVSCYYVIIVMNYVSPFKVKLHYISVAFGDGWFWGMVFWTNGFFMDVGLLCIHTIFPSHETKT